MIAHDQTTAHLEASLIATAAERDRYREALEEALTLHQVTHIHAAIRKALGK